MLSYIILAISVLIIALVALGYPRAAFLLGMVNLYLGVILALQIVGIL